MSVAEVHRMLQEGKEGYTKLQKLGEGQKKLKVNEEHCYIFQDKRLKLLDGGLFFNLMSKPAAPLRRRALVRVSGLYSV